MATHERETSEEFDARLQAIQRRFRRHSPRSVLQTALEYLYEPNTDANGFLLKHPWHVLLLIKWVFLDPDVLVPGRPSINRVDLLEILQLIHGLSANCRRPNDYEDMTLFLRATAFQQFVHQGQDGRLAIARQRALFALVPENHFLEQGFYEPPV